MEHDYAVLPASICEDLLAAIPAARADLHGPEAWVLVGPVSWHRRDGKAALDVLRITQANRTRVLATTDFSQEILIYHASY